LSEARNQRNALVAAQIEDLAPGERGSIPEPSRSEARCLGSQVGVRAEVGRCSRAMEGKMTKRALILLVFLATPAQAGWWQAT
jgi:hypothetical protein